MTMVFCHFDMARRSLVISLVIYCAGLQTLCESSDWENLHDICCWSKTELRIQMGFNPD